MDRLTKRDGANVWFAQSRPRGFLCPSEFCSSARICQKVKDRTCPYLSLLDKLAAYEDAEEQGTLFPRWIPVAERLPEKRKWVLCRCEANITEVLRYENNEWYHDPRHVYYFDFVTHWMPLPTPPQGE